MNQSLKYKDYQKRRLSVLLPVDTSYSFFNPVNYNGNKIYQVEINVEKKVRIYDGEIWEVTDDEELLYSIITRLLKKECQKEIEFREAV